jgi:hypothetical protein
MVIAPPTSVALAFLGKNEVGYPILQEVFAVLKDELSNCTPLADEFLGWELVSNTSRWVDQTWRFHLEKKCGINGCSLAKPWE